MSLSLQCDACGIHQTHLDGWVRDEFRNVFCTNTCYKEHGLKTVCVPVFGITKVLEDNEKRTIFYTDENTQHVAVRLKKGEKMSPQPERHEGSTQTMLVTRGKLKVTIYRDEVPFSFDLEPGRLTFIPCNTLHQVENLEDADALVYETYSPPEHK